MIRIGWNTAPGLIQLAQLISSSRSLLVRFGVAFKRLKTRGAFFKPFLRNERQATLDSLMAIRNSG
jgi:hypothetical protein